MDTLGNFFKQMNQPMIYQQETQNSTTLEMLDQQNQIAINTKQYRILRKGGFIQIQLNNKKPEQRIKDIFINRSTGEIQELQAAQIQNPNSQDKKYGNKKQEQSYEDVCAVMGILYIDQIAFLVTVQSVYEKFTLKNEHKVYEVENVKLSAIKTNKLEANIFQFEYMLNLNQEEIKLVDQKKSQIEKMLSQGFYYCTTYPLTLSQQAFQMSSTNLDYEEQFWWNFEMLQDFRDSQVNNIWQIQFIQGYVGHFKTTIRNIYFYLIARRSWKQGGTRYNHRGSNEDGSVANFVETEQIMIEDTNKVIISNSNSKKIQFNVSENSKKILKQQQQQKQQISNQQQQNNNNSKQIQFNTHDHASMKEIYHNDHSYPVQKQVVKQQEINSNNNNNNQLEEEEQDIKTNDLNKMSVKSNTLSEINKNQQEIKQQFPFTVASGIQIRGSIPLKWNQQGVMKNELQYDNQEHIQKMHFTNHFSKLQKNYKEILCFNLLQEKVPNEEKLSQEYKNHIGNTVYENKNLSYKFFDFHKETKGKNYTRITEVVGQLETLIEEYKFYGEKNIDDFQNLQLQEGIVRTNCLDCLDRTNVIMMNIGALMFQQMFLYFGIDFQKQCLKGRNILSYINQQQSTEYNNNIINFKHLWADMGDNISQQYAGTGASTTQITKTGTAGILEQSIKGIHRFYNQNFEDDFKHECYEIIWGKNNTWRQQKRQRADSIDKNWNFLPEQQEEQKNQSQYE